MPALPAPFQMWTMTYICIQSEIGLVLCFPYQSARIEPVAISLFLMGIGGGWIVVGLVVMDRL